MALRSIASAASRSGKYFRESVNFRPGYFALQTQYFRQNEANYSTLSPDSSEVAPPVGQPERDILYKKLDVEVRGHDPAVLKSYEWFATKTAKELEITHTETLVPKKHMERLYLLKSIFVHRKHLVQYEMRTHFRIMRFKHLTGSTADTFLEYIQRNLPEGVAMKVTKVAIESMPSHLLTSNHETDIQETIQS